MTRVAGDNDHYTWVLRNDSTGRIVKDPDTEIKFISVTTVINRTIAKPELVPWAYRRTVDSVAGGLSQLDDNAVLEIARDPFDLDEFLTQNKLRPSDVRDEAADRGHAGHDLLEKLANADLQHGPEAAFKLAERILANAANGWEAGIAQWWIDIEPDVLKSEVKLRSLRYQFAGTCDLVWKDQMSFTHVTDLKTRGAGKGVYRTDQIQVGAYDIAYEEMYGSRADVLDVLVVDENAKVTHQTVSFDARQVFLNLLDTYNILKGVK